jgi:predicted transglutaminase-like cysteine proteinase
MLRVVVAGLIVVSTADFSQAALKTVPRPDLSPSASVQFGARTTAPFGAVLFCTKRPEACKPTKGTLPTKSGRVTMSSDLMKRIASANASVNRRMKAVDDRGWKNADVWEVGAARGDCEDFALTKRALLQEIGFPSSAVLVAVGRLPRGQMHAVLVVRTTEGDFVLDNLIRAVRPIAAVEYRFEKIQSPDDPLIWLKV